MKLTTVATCLAFVSVLFAGCTDGTATEIEPKETATTTAAPPTVTSDTGSISGVVVDEEQKPIVNVEVALIAGGDLKVSSDAAGKFTFNELAPGPYKLAAQKLGYESGAKSAEVRAGEVTEVTFILQAIAVVQEYVQTQTFEGFFSCGASTPAVTLACRGLVVGAIPDKTSFTVNVSEDVMTYIDAMTWQSSAPGTARLLRNVVTIASPGSGSGQTNGPSPNIVRIDEPKTKDQTPVNHLVWIGYTGTGDPTTAIEVVYQQKFDVLTSVFYGKAAPEEYTGLPE